MSPYLQGMIPERKGCFLFLVDQSAKMAEAVGGHARPKCEEVAAWGNAWLQKLVAGATWQGAVADRYDVGVLGYRSDAAGCPIIESALRGPLSGRTLVSITELAAYGADCESPIWVEPLAEGGAATSAAIASARDLLAAWTVEHPECFPPVVIHFTGSASPEGNPLAAARRLTGLATRDGNVLLFHGYLPQGEAGSVLFPTSVDALPGDETARMLLEMSSVLPEDLRRRLVDGGTAVEPGARGMSVGTAMFELWPLFDAAPQTSPCYDENVQFTVYRPKTVAPQKWYTLLAFAHLAERPADAPPDEADPAAVVEQQAEQILGPQAREYRKSTDDSSQAVPRQGEITFVPEIDGVEFNPPQSTFRWVESVHRAEFRLRASASLEGKVARGRMSVFLGAILLADVPLSIRVSSEQAAAKAEPPKEASVGQPYHKIFASYSHRDLAIVDQVEQHVAALGHSYLRDWKDLRAGEIWNERLMQLIAEADVFQLFWSSNSMRSPFVRQEWEYALSLRRPNFIRPVYWEPTFPSAPPDLPPPNLAAIHFQQLGRAVEQQAAAAVDIGTPAADAPRPIAAETAGGPSTIHHPAPRMSPRRSRWSPARYLRAIGVIAGCLLLATFCWEYQPGGPGSARLDPLAPNSRSEVMRGNGFVPAPVRKTVFVLSVGISKYRDPSLHVKYADADARSLCDAFRQLDALFFEKVEVRELIDAQATKQKILDGLRAFDSWQAGPTRKDLVIVTLAGQGALDVHDNLFFLPYEYDPRVPLAAAGVSWDDLKGALAGLPCAAIVVIDSCRGAAAATATAGEKSQSLAELQRAVQKAIDAFGDAPQRIAVLVAMPDEQRARDSGDGQHGALSRAILEVVCGQFPRKYRPLLSDPQGRERVINLDQLNRYVAARVPELSPSAGVVLSHTKSMLPARVPVARVTAAK